MKIVFSKFNAELAKKVLSKGATLPVAGKILGNPGITQTKNKEKINLKDLQYSGRPAKGRPRIYYSKDEMNKDDLIYPIKEMSQFNSRLADELFYFHLFGYSIKDIEYKEHHMIARITFVERNEKDQCDEFMITFLDLSEVRYLNVSKDSIIDKNLFILPTTSEEDLENIAIAQEQKALLDLDSEDFSVVVSTIVGKKEYYEINEQKGLIFDSHSFLKHGGEYESSLWKYDKAEDQNSQLINYQIIDDDRKAQLSANGFALKNGKISELDNKLSNLNLKDFKIFLLDQFKDEFVITDRYFDKRYLENDSIDTALIDSILDRIASELDPKAHIQTFAELEVSMFPEFVDDQESADEEDGSEGLVSSAFSELFEGKEQDDRVQTGKLEHEKSSTEDITPISGNTEDKDLPQSHEDEKVF